jgi:hypothetical protein
MRVTVDNAGTVEQLDFDNYGAWSVRMKALLISRGLWSAVVAEEPEDDANNQKALALITLMVKDVHLATVSQCETAQEAWEKLEAVFKSKTNARKLQLRQDLNGLKKKGGEKLTEYFARAKTIWTDLLAMGHSLTETEVVWSVLAGLPKDFQMVTAILTTSEEDIGLDEILPKLMAVEQQLKLEDSVGNVEAYMAKSGRSWHEGKECWYCHEKGHIKPHCPKKKADERSGKIAIARDFVAL